jgi:hypothetical protein
MSNQFIFIIGAPRSGTSILYETLSNHSDFAYITDMDNSEHWKELVKYPDLRQRLKLTNEPLVAPKFISAGHPNEGSALWLRYLPHFEFMGENDVTPEMEHFFDEIIGHIMSRKSHFINKNIHHSYRVRLLDRLFPSCRFIHLLRDWRAVAHSELCRGRDPKRALGKSYRPDMSYMFNLGLIWKLTVSKAREAAQYGNRYFEVRYENLVKDPVGTLKELVTFSQLKWSSDFECRIPEIKDMNYKWKKDLKEQDIKDLELAVE